MSVYFKYITAVLFLVSVSILSLAQDTTQFIEKISVVGRPSQDSIVLRWAPLELSAWLTGNSNGYTVEKFVMVRNGNVLDQPEKSTLNVTPIKPLPLEQWEHYVNRNNYAAVAAQALYGDRFEIDLSRSDIFQIVNKVRENEQRFSFALFSADMSPEVAKALGLMFVDKKVKKGEKYLYRIIINQAADSLRGSIFISPDDPYDLSPPPNLKAEFSNNTVSLQWDKLSANQYTAFVIERASDGKNFRSTSETPLVTVSPFEKEETRYEYAVDSIPDFNTTYSYRVRGMTPFGELGAPSEVVSGKGTPKLSQVPYIRDGENIQNQSILLTWDFPIESNHTIKGFSVDRSESPRGNYSTVTQNLLTSDTRKYEDKSPGEVNYYKVKVHGLDGKILESPIYLAQLIDSVPPSPPQGLSASINEFGHLQLTWKPNQEKDIYGYRIYKANINSEEFAQVTREPIAEVIYNDTINLNTLNENVFYQVMAIDRNQNHSALSEKTKVALPDKLKPLPPVFLPVHSDASGVKLQWQVSGSQDVVRYDLFRKRAGEKQWIRLKTIAASQDSVYQYIDADINAGILNTYTVVAIDDAGLESNPSSPVNGQRIDNQLRTPVEWQAPAVNRENHTVLLKWQYDLSGVRQYKIYKSQDNEREVLYKSLPGNELTFSDRLVPGKQYKYKIMAVFQDGKMSAFSKEMSLNY